MGSRFDFCLFLLLVVCSAAGVAGADSSERPLLPRSIPTEYPVYADSRVDGRRLSSEVWSIVPASFERAMAELERPETWCDIVTLHMNVKACVHDEVHGKLRVRMYLGYRVFQTPEEARPLDAHLEIHREPGQLRALLAAEQGPFGTSNHRLELVATPEGADRTRLSFRLSQRFTWWARSAMQVFLATWARDKVGFTETRPGRGVRGFEGLMERNIVRFHLAIQAYLEHPNDGRAATREARWARWFQLTERHVRQLHIVKREDYLDTMSREYSEQTRLQASVNRNRMALAQ